MTTDAITADLHEPESLFCYRHPDRETWVRCGRCDQPICTRCAMQGPVGLRCRTCGKPSRDALTSLTARQTAIGAVVAMGLGAAVGYFGAQLGLFMIVIGFFAGTFIAEALDRTLGIKRGPRILTIAIGGVVIGGLIGPGSRSSARGVNSRRSPRAPRPAACRSTRSMLSCSTTFPQS